MPSMRSIENLFTHRETSVDNAARQKIACKVETCLLTIAQLMIMVCTFPDMRPYSAEHTLLTAFKSTPCILPLQPTAS